MSRIMCRSPYDDDDVDVTNDDVDATIDDVTFNENWPSIGSAMKKSLVTDSAGWCFRVYSASTRIQNAQTERRKLYSFLACKSPALQCLVGVAVDLFCEQGRYREESFCLPILSCLRL